MIDLTHGFAARGRAGGGGDPAGAAVSAGGRAFVGRRSRRRGPSPGGRFAPDRGRMLVGPDNGLLALAAETGGGVSSRSTSGARRSRSSRSLRRSTAVTSSPLWRRGSRVGRFRTRPVTLRSWGARGAGTASAAPSRGRRVRGPRAVHRPLRQRGARRTHDDFRRRSGRARREVEVERSAGAAPTRPVRADFRRRRRRRLLLYEDSYRGLALAANPGRRRGAARPPERRRRTPDPARRERRRSRRPALGTPRLHLRRTDSTNARARELAGRGSAARDAGHRRRADRGPGTAGSHLERTARPGAVGLAGAARAATAAAADRGGRGRRGRADRGRCSNGQTTSCWTARKVAGILVEGRPQERWAVLGIGLNVALRKTELPFRATRPGSFDGARARGHRAHPDGGSAGPRALDAAFPATRS